MIRPNFRAPRLRFVLVALAVVVSAGGCAVQTDVGVTVRADGSGVIRVSVRADAEAVKAVEAGGSKLETGVRFGDLAGTGWTVGPWDRAADGSASVVLSHPFANVSEVSGILASASGKGGPLGAVHATRAQGLFSTDYDVTGSADLRHVSTGVAGDAELVTRLKAQGIDLAALDQQLLAQLNTSFTLRVVVRVPDRAPVTIVAKPAKKTAVAVSSSVRNTQHLVLVVVALGCLGVAAGLWFRGGRAGRPRRRGRRPGPRPAPQGRSGPGPAPAPRRSRPRP